MIFEMRNILKLNASLLITYRICCFKCKVLRLVSFIQYMIRTYWGVLIFFPFFFLQIVHC